ncbi:phage tail protein [Kitasatospora sp. CB01950]|uniref:phage tail protein n=1 Tax=Kitasatospora sp. CB01950 TaxID=1703930 RepID=UPI00093D94C8|nr:phage tail protein [Kitasatospora sp. CB01950]OKJ06825.1 phage tail protein [Kitasatospora sp. CB01950]
MAGGLPHVTKLFSIVDCKITALTTDPIGGTATYAATSVDLPGIRSLAINGNMQTKSLRGDNTLLDTQTYIDGVTAAAEHAKLSLDALAVMLGGTVTDSGATPAQKAVWSLTANSAPQYFKIEGVTPSNGSDLIGGDVHVVLYKCTLSKFPELGMQGDDYRIPKFEVSSVPLASTGKWMDVVMNETAVAIP